MIDLPLELDFTDYTFEDMDIARIDEFMAVDTVIEIDRDLSTADLIKIWNVVTQSFKSVNVTMMDIFPVLTRVFTRFSNYIMTDKNGLVATPKLHSMATTVPYIPTIAVNMPRHVYEDIPYSLRSYTNIVEWHMDRDSYTNPHHIITITTELEHVRPPRPINTVKLCGREPDQCMEWNYNDYLHNPLFTARLWLTLNGYDPTLPNIELPLILTPIRSRGKDQETHKKNYIWNVINRFIYRY